MNGSNRTSQTLHVICTGMQHNTGVQSVNSGLMFFFFFNDWDRTPIAVRGRQQYGSEGIVIDELKPFRQDKRWVQNNCCSLKRLYYRDLSLQGFESNQFQHRRGQVWEGNLI